MNKVILYNFGLILPFEGGNDPQYNCGLNYIAQALKEIGVETVLLSPNPDYGFDQPLAIGFSTWTMRFEEMGKFSSKIKNSNPDVPLIAGGPHFSKPMDRVAEERLLETKIDAYSTGSGQGFIELIKSLKEESVSYNGSGFRGEIPDGIFVREGNSFVGSENRGLLKVKKFPEKSLQFFPGGVNLNVDSYLLHVFTSACGNGCDYCNFCNIVNFESSFEELYSNFLDHLDHEIRTILITSIGGNGSSRRILQEIERVGIISRKRGYTPAYALYGDPSDLLFIDNFEEATNFFASNRIIMSFWGRETVQEKIALKLGRRYRGVCRDQERLNNEREVLKRFLVEINKHQRMKIQFTISYIFTPWETKESINSLREEIKEFTQMRSILKNIELRTIVLNLVPFTGCSLRRKYYDIIDHNLPFEKYDCVHSVWRSRIPKIFAEEAISYTYKHPNREKYQFIDELLESVEKKV